MRIRIAERLRPFSHQPGSLLLLPGTGVEVEAFPALLRFRDLTQFDLPLIAEQPLPVQGPVKGFTVQQDLERGVINVWGKGAKGYYRYQIRCENGQICISARDGSEQKLGAGLLQTHISQERLSLGMHKAQDWELIRRRGDLKEIFPLWFRLGRMIPEIELPKGGTEVFLTPCINQSQLDPYFNLFLAGFVSMLSPRLTDETHQGFTLPKIEKEGSPLVLLSLGAQYIRTLFIQQMDGGITLLPHLPKEFHCGRMTNISLGALGTLELEWSKKSLRRLIFRCCQSESIQLQIPKQIKSCRLRHTKQEKGERIPCPITLDVTKDKIYLFDNFQF